MTNKKKFSLGWIILIAVSLFGMGIASAAIHNGPEVSIPSQVPALANSTVDIPVTFISNGASITAMTFSIDYDETWLAYDNTVNTITFYLPGAYAGNCDFDPLDNDGELDCSVFGFGTDIPPIPDDVFLSIQLNTLDAPDQTTANLNFADDPAVSFGDTNGNSIPGTASNGSVQFGNGAIYIPLILKIFPTPTATPQFSPTPTATPTPTPTGTIVTETPTATPTATSTLQPTCENIIVDWSFEDKDGWTLNPTNYQAQYTDQRSNSGDWSVVTGILTGPPLYSYSSVSQNIAIPDNIDSATLTFWHFSQSSETRKPVMPPLMQQFIYSLKPELYDQQYAIAILKHAPDDPVWLYSAFNNNERQWVQESVDMADFEGEEFTLRFSTRNDSSGGITAMFVDDVILEVCR